MRFFRFKVGVSLITVGALGLFCFAQQPDKADVDTYGKETLSNIGSGKNLELNETTVTGPVMTGKNVTGHHCRLGHVIGREVTLSHCQVKQISATKAVVLLDTVVDGRINAGGNSEFIDSTVEGDVVLRESAIIKNSVLKGKLTVMTDRLTVEGSKISSIHLRHGKSGMTHHVMITGGSVTKGPDGRTLLKVQGNGKAIFGGFALEGVEEGTQMKTPEGFIYLNGQRVGVEGPETYGTYQSTHSDAPAIEGPNWVDGIVVESVPPKETALDTEPLQVIELTKGTVVTGNIEFGSGHGQVRVMEGAVVKGNVIGGTVEKEK